MQSERMMRSNCSGRHGCISADTCAAGIGSGVFTASPAGIPQIADPMPPLRAAIRQCRTRVMRGRAERISGTMIEARIAGVRVGDLCRLRDPLGVQLDAEVVGVTEGRAFLTPIGEVSGLSSLTEVEPCDRRLGVPVGEALLGRVLDGLGRVLDRPDDPPHAEATIPIDAPPPPLGRPPISRMLSVGTRAIDGLTTCAEGQRIGIFGAAGACKSRLIARIVRHAEADVFVIALVGERGREVGEFLDHALGAGARGRAVTVVATSDRPALERVKAAQVATAIAEWFRDRGRRVVLLIDSLTRLARAWREIGLAAGEPPTRRGFPPSVFAALPRLLERAASTRTGWITAFYTVLVEGDLASDPIAEEVKSILDGHLILSSALAEAGHHPAIDVLASASWVMDQVVDRPHRDAAVHLRRLLARYNEVELLVRIGEYQAGSDTLADEALRKIDAIRAFLREAADETTSCPTMLRRLQELAA
jgi:ATP synthase in type III secretion protein N